MNTTYQINTEQRPFEWLTRVAERQIKIEFSTQSTVNQCFTQRLQGVVQRFFDAIVHFFMYRFNQNYHDFYEGLLQGRVSAFSSTSEEFARNISLNGNKNSPSVVPISPYDINKKTFGSATPLRSSEEAGKGSTPSPLRLDENLFDSDWSSDEGEKASSTPRSKNLKTHPQSPATSVTTEVCNHNLAERIRTTPRYDSPFAIEMDPDFRLTASTRFSKQYLDPFTHVHQIFEFVYLGDYRGYLSVDPRFVERYAMYDDLSEIADLSTIPSHSQESIRRNVESQLDRVGASQLHIRYILSVTQFQPGPNVKSDDWSRFEPNLQQIDRLELHLDDDEFAWDNLEPHLEEAFEFIDQARQERQPCLIHCVKGASRSVTVLTAYLMNRCGVSLDEAFNFIVSQRTVAELKPSIRRGLEEYERKLNHSKNSGI